MLVLELPLFCSESFVWSRLDLSESPLIPAEKRGSTEHGGEKEREGERRMRWREEE